MPSLFPALPTPQELQLQDKMLNDLEHKTDKTQAKMDQTNDRMKVRRQAIRSA